MVRVYCEHGELLGSCADCVENVTSCATHETVMWCYGEMSETTEHKVDRTGWASGPWDGEPDKLNWKTAAGLPGMIVRNGAGALCGYVGLPTSHPLYGNNARHAGEDAGQSRLVDLSVHGGITYGNACAGHICHVPAPGEPDDVWWLGFDCNHSGDLAPGRSSVLLRSVFFEDFSFDGTYKDVAYVRDEVESLAAQLVALPTSSDPEVER
jgi:hypothetical protein